MVFVWYRDLKYNQNSSSISYSSISALSVVYSCIRFDKIVRCVKCRIFIIFYVRFLFMHWPIIIISFFKSFINLCYFLSLSLCIRSHCGSLRFNVFASQCVYTAFLGFLYFLFFFLCVSISIAINELLWTSHITVSHFALFY